MKKFPFLRAGELFCEPWFTPYAFSTRLVHSPFRKQNSRTNLWRWQLRRRVQKSIYIHSRSIFVYCLVDSLVDDLPSNARFYPLFLNASWEIPRRGLKYLLERVVSPFARSWDLSGHDFLRHDFRSKTTIFHGWMTFNTLKEFKVFDILCCLLKIVSLKIGNLSRYGCLW